MEVRTTFSLKDRCQILLLLSSKFKQINASIPHVANKKTMVMISRGNRSYLIHLKSLNIRSKIWRRYLKPHCTVLKNLMEAFQIKWCEKNRTKMFSNTGDT